MYPAGAAPSPDAENWTYDAMLKAAEACQKVNMTFGIGTGTTADSVDTAGAMFAAYGAEAMNAKGEITVKSDKVREVLQIRPAAGEIPARRRRQLRRRVEQPRTDLGQIGADLGSPVGLGCRPPRRAEGGRGLLDLPRTQRPRRPFHANGRVLLGRMEVRSEQVGSEGFNRIPVAARQLEARCNASLGYDVPPFVSMSDFKVWAEVGSPKGTVYHYPVRASHKEKTHIALSPAPPGIAVQIYNRGTLPTMFAKLQSGQSIKQVLDWARDEIEGFTR